MRLLHKLFGGLGIACQWVCVATVVAQAAGLGLAWSRGVLSQGKLVQYAGVIYGLQPLDLAPARANNRQSPEPESPEKILADRVNKTPRLTDRVAAIEHSTAELRGLTSTLKRNREKYVSARDGFEALLKELEATTETTAIRELQTTMEIVSPKQAKEILRSMLQTPSKDPTDDVVADVVRIIKSLPDDKLRKILAEFKSEDERRLLHRILVEIGGLDERTAPVTGAPP